MDGEDTPVLVRGCLREDRAERTEVLLQDSERDPPSVCIISALLGSVAGGLRIGKIGKRLGKGRSVDYFDFFAVFRRYRVATARG